MKKVIANVLLFLIALVPVSSLAQSGEKRIEIGDVNPELKSDGSFTSLSESEQQALLTEAVEVHQRCLSRKSYATYHDCGCLKARFVGIRIENPETPQALLLSRLSKVCPNIPGIRDMAYNGCKNISITRISDRSSVTAWRTMLPSSTLTSPSPALRSIRSITTGPLESAPADSSVNEQGFEDGLA